jgi:hypothetical protein
MYRDVGIPENFYPNLPYIFRTLLYRQWKNMNTFILIVGNPRTSKSYCAMNIGENYSKYNGNVFDVEKQLTFDDIKKFLVWSQNAYNSIFILDETGTTLSPDLWFSLQQRIMRRFVQTQGFRKNVLIWVLPSVVFLQKGFRFMCNYAIQTLRQGLVEIYKIKVNQLVGKGYPDKIEIMNFGKPSNETEEKYLAMKQEWNDNQLQQDVDFMTEIEKPYMPIEKIKMSIDNNIGDITYHKEPKYLVL